MPFSFCVASDANKDSTFKLFPREILFITQQAKNNEALKRISKII